VVGVAVVDVNVDVAGVGVGGDDGGGGNGGGGDGNGDGDARVEMRLLSCAALAAPVHALLGVRGTVLYFLDAAGWVCSVEVRGWPEHYTRHFFVPPTWYPPSGGIVRVPVALVSRTAVAFSRGEGLVVFHGGLEFGEEVPLERDVDAVGK
jgi:hypothetical protein